MDPEICRACLSKREATTEAESCILEAMSREEEMQVEPEPARKTRASRVGRMKALRPHCINLEGAVVFFQPKEAFWCRACIPDPIQVISQLMFVKKFRRRFRLSHEAFVSFHAKLVEDECFQKWNKGENAARRSASPLGLLLLGALRRLDRGLTFCDLGERASIGEETHRRFFHVFLDCGSEVLCPFHVKMPRAAAERETHQHEFDIGGLNGAGFSTDATNVIIWRCSHNLESAHVGFKNSHLARTRNRTINRRRRTTNAAKGRPSRWNDKSLACQDKFMRSVKNGTILQDALFELVEWTGASGESDVHKRVRRGAWGIVDNGCHKWSRAQALAKICFLRTEQRFSQWLESFCKDSECAFGILKSRFRILQAGVRLHGEAVADKVWLT